MPEDTITAIATPNYEAALAIIRISGLQSFEIISKIFQPQKNISFNTVSSHTAHYGTVTDPDDNSQIIDEVIVTMFRAPRSYTTEDMIEISCHGNPLLAQKILHTIIKAGARLAMPGEFTKRAFLNGRIDLTQAEAVIDLITAKTDTAAQAAIKHLQGAILDRYKIIQDSLLNILTELETQIDFPEDVTSATNNTSLRSRLLSLKKTIHKLVDSYKNGSLIKNGLSVAITGKVNTGKSSLFNILSHRPERALVSHVPATTRDIIKEYILINGRQFTIMDTAGMKTPRGIVEKQSLTLTRREIKEANLIIFILDASKSIGPKDLAIWNLVRNKKPIVVINKIDLQPKISPARIEKKLKIENVHCLSCKTEEGIDSREEKIVHQSRTLMLPIPDNYPVINNIRHKIILQKIDLCLSDALIAIEKNLSAEFISADIRNALENLEELTGKRVTEQVLETIFSKFCIGK